VLTIYSSLIDVEWLESRVYSTVNTSTVYIGAYARKFDDYRRS
jgi:hypothetical protein